MAVIIDSNICIIEKGLTCDCLLGGGDPGHEYHQGHPDRKICQTTKGWWIVCVWVGKKKKWKKKLSPPAVDNFTRNVMLKSNCHQKMCACFLLELTAQR